MTENKHTQGKCPICGQKIGVIHAEQDFDGDIRFDRAKPIALETEYICSNPDCPMQTFVLRETVNGANSERLPL